MYYKLPTDKQIKSFQTQGFLILEDCLDPCDLDIIEQCCDEILALPEKFKSRLGPYKKKDQPQEFNILQVAGSKYFPHLKNNRALNWVRAISCFFMSQEIDFWFDQFLIKPPHNNHETPWHQDEAYWGRALSNKAITAWIPLQNVNKDNGCMHFVSNCHNKDIFKHHRPQNIKSDLLCCDINNNYIIECPIKRGSITLHHVRTPHMTTKNNSDFYRKALCLHLKNPNVTGEGELYPWRVYVNQTNSEGKDVKSPLRKDDYYF